jgi:hypothetical protein
MLPAEIGQLIQLQSLDLTHNQLATLPAEIGQLTQLQYLNLNATCITKLPLELGRLPHLQRLAIGISTKALIFPPPEIVSQGGPITLAYLRDYTAMQMRQTLAAVAGGVGAIAGILLAFRWRQRRGLHKKKKRL